MPKADLRKLITLVRKDRALQSSITAAPDKQSLTASILAVARIHGLDVSRQDVQDGIDDLNRVQANPPKGTQFTPEQERVLATSLAGLCLGFPPTTDWTNVAKPGNPCGPSLSANP